MSSVLACKDFGPSTSGTLSFVSPSFFFSLVVLLSFLGSTLV